MPGRRSSSLFPDRRPACAHARRSLPRPSWHPTSDHAPFDTAARKLAAKHETMRACDRRCVYCGTALAFEVATLDHVVPRARGGTSDRGNLVTACARCNRLKAALPPLEFFLLHPWAGANFLRYAHAAHRTLKRLARRAVSLAHAA